MGIAALFLLPAFAAEQRLILKDGTDQLVRSYEIVGDRVRYESAERNGWEELPAELVDWEATERVKREAEELAAGQREEALEAQPRTIAPGVSLPEKEGVYLFDGVVLQPLEQAQAEVDNDRTRTLLSILTPVPVVKGRAWIRLAGARAKASAATSLPAVYLQLSQISSAGYAWVRLEQKDDSRIVGEIRITPLTGKMEESREVVSAALEQVSPARAEDEPAIWRLVPSKPLEPGEYAIVELVAKEKQNLFVWDFRVAPPVPSGKP
jgi:hypothetical protein